jgi:hypothetical protein
MLNPCLDEFTAIKHKFLIAMFAVVLATTTTFAFALPGPAACLLLGVSDLQKLPDGSLAESESAVDQQHFAQLMRDARLRIESTFGAVESKPIIVFFDLASCLTKVGPASLYSRLQRMRDGQSFADAITE